eukprot:2882923-Amphidinium_carterae.1
MSVPQQRQGMSEQKWQLIPFAREWSSWFLQSQGIDWDADLECDLGELTVKMRGAPVVEIFSPERLTKQSGALGLRPGFAVDVCERKPYQPSEVSGPRRGGIDLDAGL